MVLTTIYYMLGIMLRIVGRLFIFVTQTQKETHICLYLEDALETGKMFVPSREGDRVVEG